MPDENKKTDVTCQQLQRAVVDPKVQPKEFADMVIKYEMLKRTER